MAMRRKFEWIYDAALMDRLIVKASAKDGKVPWEAVVHPLMAAGGVNPEFLGNTNVKEVRRLFLRHVQKIVNAQGIPLYHSVSSVDRRGRKRKVHQTMATMTPNQLEEAAKNREKIGNRHIEVAVALRDYAVQRGFQIELQFNWPQ